LYFTFASFVSILITERFDSLSFCTLMSPPVIISVCYKEGFSLECRNVTASA